MRAVHVVGGGPAGVMAAFAAMREGAGVRIASPTEATSMVPWCQNRSGAGIVSSLPVHANPRITTAPRRPTDGRAGHRAIGEKCCTQIRKAYRTRKLLWPQPPFERP